MVDPAEQCQFAGKLNEGSLGDQTVNEKPRSEHKSLIFFPLTTETSDPSSAWSRIRFMHAWKRYQEMEDHLISLRSLAPTTCTLTESDTQAVDTVWNFRDTIRPDDIKVASLLASEAIQHLRIALEHLVYNAGWKHRGSRPKRTQFPIVSRPDRWAAVRKTSLTYLSEEHVERLEAVQPFNGCSWTSDLQSLSNPDKHEYSTLILPAVEFQGTPHLDPEDNSLSAMDVDRTLIVAWLAGEVDTEYKLRKASPVFANLFQGAATLINLFLSEEGEPLIQGSDTIHVKA